jgi:hypothetical protein
LDVRRAEEYDSARIKGAVNIPIHELPQQVDEVPDGELWVHCASGYRASIAASVLDPPGAGSWPSTIAAPTPRRTGQDNGGTEAINGVIEKTRRLAHGFRNFENYRLRILLAADGTRRYRERRTHA